MDESQRSPLYNESGRQHLIPLGLDEESFKEVANHLLLDWIENPSRYGNSLSQMYSQWIREICRASGAIPSTLDTQQLIKNFGLPLGTALWIKRSLYEPPRALTTQDKNVVASACWNEARGTNTGTGFRFYLELGVGTRLQAAVYDYVRQNHGPCPIIRVDATQVEVRLEEVAFKRKGKVDDAGSPAAVLAKVLGLPDDSAQVKRLLGEGKKPPVVEDPVSDDDQATSSSEQGQ